jgi:carbon-monoxide dehydrogenase medium subunit
MKPPRFEYHVAEDVPGAIGLLTDLGEDAKLIAGGQSLVPMLSLRLAVPEHLVDLRKVAELRGTRKWDDGLWIGALTTQAAIERSPEIAGAVPLLARATPLIGHFQIRNRGTLGGSCAHADAAAEYPAVAIALGATFEIASRTGTRSVPASGFFTGLWSTALEPEEVLTGVGFPFWGGRSGFAVEEFARRSGDFALAGAAVAVSLDSRGLIERCGIGLFGLGSSAVPAAVSLVGRSLSDLSGAEIGANAVAGLGSVTSDLHGSADYRRHIGAAIVARAWERAAEEAGHA